MDCRQSPGHEMLLGIARLAEIAEYLANGAATGARGKGKFAPMHPLADPFSCPLTETESQLSRLTDSMNRQPVDPLLPLCQLPAGAVGRVRELSGDASFCQRVREMGFGESAFVTKISGRGPFVCQINDTRIALSHGAARNILVEQIVRR
jgi:ferrous iron transport protein A